MTDQDTMPAVDLEGTAKAYWEYDEGRWGADFRPWEQLPEAERQHRINAMHAALSATPLSQAPAGQGVEWPEVFPSKDAALDAALRATRPAAQPTQDDAKRLREALDERHWRGKPHSVLVNIVLDALASKTGDTDHAPEQ